MTDIIISILSLLCLAYIFWSAYKKDKHYKWFNNLKPGDKVLVTIYSDNCECQKESMIVSEPFNKYVEAYLSTDIKRTCRYCYKTNGMKNRSCKYDITLFHRNSVNKLE